MKKSIISIILLLAVCIGANAHDFAAMVNGQKLYFNISNKLARTASVTYCGSIADKIVPEVSGVVQVPATVKHGGVVYKITSIEPKAFCGAMKLEGIVLPSGITKIGDFAFEGCTSLSKVVFPGNVVQMGQGVFFKCYKIKDVTIGSDWKSIDLSMFRWSDSLTTLAIPAKVEKIANMKKLKHLETITIDVNNSRFVSVDGVLYNRDTTTLYGVPRAFVGKLKVQEGTVAITRGALIDCPGITHIDLPSTLQSMSFRETSRMAGLEEIVLRAEQPMATAYSGGVAKLAFQVINRDVKIIVPNDSKKAYQEALAHADGEYAEDNKAGSVPYALKATDLPKEKAIKGVKNFKDYDE